MVKLHKKLKDRKAVLNRLLINPGNYGAKERIGRPKVLSSRQKKQILACQQKRSSEIKGELQLACTSRTIRNVLNKNPNVRYKKSQID